MKTYILALVLFLAAIRPAAAQSILDSAEILTPNGMFDIVYDAFGNQYSLSSLMIGRGKPIGGPNSVNAGLIVGTCTAGHFKLHFEANSIFTLTAAQNVMCQLFTDISNFIPSNIPPGSVHILCGIGIGAQASPFYTFPNVPFNPSSGVLDGMVYKALITGQDPYLGLPLTTVNGNAFYHGVIFAGSNTWSYNTGITTLTPGDYDLATIMLHESMHLLGIHTLIDSIGNSQFSVPQSTSLYYNFYSRYDTFLYDHAGNPLLSVPNPTTAFFAPPSASVIAPASCVQTGGSFQDVTTCSLAAQYIGSTVIPVYTPPCYEAGSSLAHFEDMCAAPAYTTVCTGTAGNWNNMYYVMANATATDVASCYVKRHLQDEERLVLCDLGYTVNATYGSTVAGSSYTYNAGPCTPPITVYGINDGMAANVCTLVTNSASIVVSYSTLTSNDSPTLAPGLQVTNLVSIYNDVTIAYGMNDFTVTAPLGAGMRVLQYFPQHLGSGVYGNMTYVSLYFTPPGCLSCNHINNGGFEHSNYTTSGNECGSLSAGPFPAPSRWLDCWEPYYPVGASLYSNSCPGFYQLGVNTQNTSPPVNTLNIGANANNNCLGLVYDLQQNGVAKGSLKNKLSSPLVQGTTYEVSFWAINHGSTPTSTSINTPGNPLVISIASHSVFAFTPTLNFPAGLDVLTQFTINAGNTWALYTHTFTYAPANPAQAAIIGIDLQQTAPPASVTPLSRYLCLVDEFAINPAPAPKLALPPPSSCGLITFTDLAQYVSPATTGTFSGPGVTANGNQYDFNSPASSGNFLVAFTYSDVAAACLNTVYDMISSTTCCSNTTTPTFTETSVSSNTFLVGPLNIASDFTVQSGATCVFYGGEFIFAPNVKITVASGGVLHIQGSHLYTCGPTMWKGILVEDGGLVYTAHYNGNDNLIEDAEVAFDVSNYTANVTNTIISLWNTTFNKNYIDINFSNYPITSHSYGKAIAINHCVFTCRNFAFTSTSWPGTSTADLRSAANPTTGLGAPYLLQNAPIVDLKGPYAGQRSHIAIQIENAGTTGTLYPASTIFTFYPIQIGTAAGGSPTDDFLLFDAHETFIAAANSNIKVTNCVFQNTQTLTANSTATAGAAISITYGIFNGSTDLGAANKDVGNRFWDCHRAVDVVNAYELTIENATFRSTQSSLFPSLPGFVSVGERGVYMNTNRFENYQITHNEFSNICDAVSMVCVPGDFYIEDVFGNYATPTYTVWLSMMYCRDVAVSSNTFCPETNTAFTGPTNNYVRNGITITAPLHVWSTFSNLGIAAQDNLMYRVMNGISYSGMNCVNPSNHVVGPPKIISSNTITLEPDPWFNPQKGIEYVNSISAPGGFPTLFSQARQTVENNVLDAYGAPVTNPLITLVYAFNNGGTGTVLPCPFMICNTVKDAYNGFVFDGPNEPVYWRGNEMDNLSRGMSLTNAGRIGQQGSSAAPSDNQWTGSWGSGDALYVGTGSQAQLSPLYIRSGAPWEPPSYNGSVLPLNWYDASGGTLTATGAYTCGAGYNQKVVPLPNPGNYDSDALLYIANMQAYRYLAGHDSIKNSDDELIDFYDLHNEGSLGIFTLIEDTLSRGNFDVAQDLLEELDPLLFNAVELNYYTFYNLYVKSLRPDDPEFSQEDLEELTELANLCPGTNGVAVYQARSLYLRLTGRVFNPTESCGEGEGDRRAHSVQAPQKAKELENLLIYPNPASSQLNFRSKAENEFLFITIKDLSGRTILAVPLKITDFIATLDLDLINGAYLITISNATKEEIHKKLLIAK